MKSSGPHTGLSKTHGRTEFKIAASFEMSTDTHMVVTWNLRYPTQEIGTLLHEMDSENRCPGVALHTYV